MTTFDLPDQIQSLLGKLLFEAFNLRDRLYPTMTDSFVYAMHLETYGLECHHPNHLLKWYGRSVVCSICHKLIEFDAWKPQTSLPPDGEYLCPFVR